MHGVHKEGFDCFANRPDNENVGALISEISEISKKSDKSKISEFVSARQTHATSMSATL